MVKLKLGFGTIYFGLGISIINILVYFFIKYEYSRYIQPFILFFMLVNYMVYLDKEDSEIRTQKMMSLTTYILILVGIMIYVIDILINTLLTALGLEISNLLKDIFQIIFFIHSLSLLVANILLLMIYLYYRNQQLAISHV